MQKEMDLFKKIANRATSQILNLQNEKQELLKVNFVVYDNEATYQRTIDFAEQLLPFC